MAALAGDLPHPPIELAIDGLPIGVGEVPRPKEVAFHVLDARLDPPFLLGVAGRGGVHLEAVVTRQLAVAAIERRIVSDSEGGADDSGFEIIGHHRLDHPSEHGERLGM